MKHPVIFTLLLLLTTSLLHAETIKVGEPLPAIEVRTHRGGELFLVDDEIEYRDWYSQNLTGKTRVIYHLAARMGIDKVNAKTVDAMDELHLPLDVFNVVTIINADDVAFGASNFAKKEIEKNRRKHKNPEFVLDMKSRIQEHWNLKRKSSTLIIVDENNVVRFFKDGKLNKEEHQQFLSVLAEVQPKTETANLEN